MAVIHRTTMTPGKLELLATWLPAQPWYAGAEREPERTKAGPELTKAGGFRLDDPDGEVGIEFMVVTDTSGGRPTAYHVPLTYRGAPLDGAGQALIGTSEHGVLGRRWIYDGAHDPVLVAQLLAFLQGRAEAQAQGVSNTPDPSVSGRLTGDGVFPAVIGTMDVVTGSHGTDVVVETRTDAGSPGEPASRLTLRVVRVLQPHSRTSPAEASGSRGHVTAVWQSPDGGECHGRFIAVHDPVR